MTNKEAIEILTNVKNTPQITWTNGADVAFDHAIEALKNERPYGEWKHYSITANYCSICKRPYAQSCKNFCCYCGADMRGGKNDTMHNM